MEHISCEPIMKVMYKYALFDPAFRALLARPTIGRQDTTSGR